MRGGWIPDQIPDRLRNARWTLTPRHILILVAVLAIGLTWATWTFVHARPTPIPETHPATTTPGTPVTQPGTGPTQPGAGTNQPGAAPTQPGAVSTQLGTGATQTGTGPNQPGAGPTQPGPTQPGAASIQPGAAQTPPDPAQSPGTATSSGPQLVVYVAGKVRRPGLVHAPPGSRVADVLTLAGGPLRGVDLTTLNLARPVTDGEQINVGLPTQPSPPNPSTTSTTTSPRTAPGTTVNLNTATIDQLDTLPGVGPVLAQRILDYRTQNGPFTTIDQLQEVPGVGPKKYDSLKSHVGI
ncbi:hypothetical protein GCM10010530_60110 [Kribbella aluminosa]